MKPVTPEQDRLLWIVAESNDPRMVAEFEAANPGLIAELAKRSAMVQALRSARPGAGVMGVPPEFHPRLAMRPLASRRTIFAGAVAGFAVVAFASFFVTSHFLRPAEPPVAAPFAPDETPIQMPTPQAVQVTPPAPVTTTPPRQSTAQTNVDRLFSAPPSASEREGRVGARRFPVPDEEEPQMQFRVANAPLLSVIETIAVQSGLTIEMPPNFPNPTISVDIAGSTGLRLLQRLGQQNGFTAFDEGNNVILLIPAIEGEEPAETE